MEVIVEYEGARHVLSESEAKGILRDLPGARIVGEAPRPPEPPPEPGIVDRAKDLFTGDSRRTETTEGAQDLTMSPEWAKVGEVGGARNTMSARSIGDDLRKAGQVVSDAVSGDKPAAEVLGDAGEVVFSGINRAARGVPGEILNAAKWAAGGDGPMLEGGVQGALTRAADRATGGALGVPLRAAQEAASPAEQFQMILAANPDIKPETDERGNRFFRSANGKIYSEQPGLRLTDSPRIAANAIPFMATGGLATTVPRAIAAGVATQGVLEAGQAASGGDFDPGEVALAGGLNAIGPAVGAIRGARAARAAAPAAEVVEEVAEAAPAVAKAAKGAPVDDVRLADIAKRAADGSPAAKQQLAEIMAVDEGAFEAAKRLGIELPADVLSESEQIRSAFGGIRGKTGSEAEAAWLRTVKAATDKADEVVQSFDGAPSPAAVSDKVLQSMQGSRETLRQEAKGLYSSVDQVIKPNAPITVENIAKVVKESIADLGGDASQLSAGEKMLMDIAERGRTDVLGIRPNRPTFDALRRLKADVQQATRGIGAFATNDQRRLKILERALKADELANAERIGGAEIRDKVRAAHQLTARQKGLEQRIIGAFGKEMEGSAAALIEGAITDASKGNAARLTKMLKVVPEDLQGEVLMTALSSTSRAKGGVAKGEFGFSEFASTYAGLRRKGNEAVYARIAKSLGPERERVLRDLYEISKRITDARANVKGTGKANQVFMQALEAESLVQRLAGSSMGRAAAIGAGGAGFGGLGAIAGGGILEAIAKGNKDVVLKVGKLMTSPEFQALAIEAVTKPQVSQQTVRKVVRSRFWREYAKAAKIPRDPTSGEKWLMAALQAARQERRE